MYETWQGGYPNGYPPQYFVQPMGAGYYCPPPGVPQHDFSSPYSPFPNMGGVVDMRVMPNGQVVSDTAYVQQQQAQGYVAQPIQQPQQNSGGFNPYQDYGIQPRQPQTQVYSSDFGYYMNPPGAYQTNTYGYGGYSYGYNGSNPYLQYQQQAQYNSALSEQLYSESISVFDPMEYLVNVILTSEEQQLSRMNTPSGYGYNGTPWFTNEQIAMQNAEKQKQMELSIQFCARLSKIAHAATGQPITDKDARALYDPKMHVNPYQQSVHQMTQDDIYLLNEENMVKATEISFMQSLSYEYNEQLRLQKVAEGYAKIKESHDRVLGLKEGEKDLKNYLANAGVLYVDAIARESKYMRKDGTLKYQKGSYVNALLKANPQAANQLPISMFTNDDYIPIEQRIKERYIAAKSKLIPNRDGSWSPPPPPPVSKEVEEQRNAFLRAATEGIQLT